MIGIAETLFLVVSDRFNIRLYQRFAIDVLPSRTGGKSFIYSGGEIIEISWNLGEYGDRFVRFRAEAVVARLQGLRR